MIRILSWNINSVRKRIDQLARIVDAYAPDIICLQETKVSDAAFPHADMLRIGYEHVAVYGYGGYNGVAILSRHPLSDIQSHPRRGKNDGRHISAMVAPEGRTAFFGSLVVCACGRRSARPAYK